MLLPGHSAHSVISIHAPRTGSDMPSSSIWAMPFVFQSTLPARGATDAEYTRSQVPTFQSTLPARGATVGTSAFSP